VIRRRAVVHGLVQGVGFRYACARQAEALGVAGWVRNRPDDTVEAVVQGEPGAVEDMVTWLRQGPRHARVSKVDVVDEEPEHLAGFRVAD
jgi:acylphosphatase